MNSGQALWIYFLLGIPVAAWEHYADMKENQGDVNDEVRELYKYAREHNVHWLLLFVIAIFWPIALYELIKAEIIWPIVKRIIPKYKDTEDE